MAKCYREPLEGLCWVHWLLLVLRAGNRSKFADESELHSLSKRRVGGWYCIKLG